MVVQVRKERKTSHHWHRMHLHVLQHLYGSTSESATGRIVEHKVVDSVLRQVYKRVLS